MSLILFFIILFHYYIYINCESWWGLVNGYKLEDHNYGYAGSSYTRAIDFYLCGERYYQVHYLGDDPLIWSKNFTNCEPVGNGKEIDGICIHGNKWSYRGRLFRESAWLQIIRECNIYDKNSFAGNLGRALSCICINGEDYYRIGYASDGEIIKSSNPKLVFDRIINNIFGNNNIKYNIEDNKENLIEFKYDNKLFNSTIQILTNTEVNIDGNEIKVIIEKEKIIHSFWGGDINNLLSKKLKNILNFDINEERKNFENIIAKETMNGVLTIHSFWKDKIIIIDSGVRIHNDIQGIRGGYKLKLNLKDTDILINKLKQIIKLISKYIDIKKRIEIENDLKNINSISDFDEIIKKISPYDILITQIIFLYIIQN